jgi:hypothetical protein
VAIIISPRVRKKLAEKDPPVARQEIVECFQNRTKRALIDNRQQHKTKPPTRWFIAETNFGRKLKVVFITYPSGDHVIKSAFEPYEYEEWIYENETKI